jgi:hypothetical protein
MRYRKRLRLSVEGNCKSIEKSNLSEDHTPKAGYSTPRKTQLACVPFEHTFGIVPTFRDAEFWWKKLNCYVCKSDFPVSATNLYHQFALCIRGNPNVLGNPRCGEYVISARVNKSLDVLAA